MTYIRRVKTKSGAAAIQIVRKIHGRIISVDHIGSAHTHEEEQRLRDIAWQQLHSTQPSLFPEPQRLILQSSCSRLLYRVLSAAYQRLGFDCLADPVYAHLCIARLVEPTSKVDSIRVLAELGVTDVDKHQLYRALTRVVVKDYRKIISRLCFTHAAAQPLSLVLYDVTSLYFETQRGDDFRKPGLSKERRLEPQIIIGLLVNQSGFPLGLQSFAGNVAETKTILPVLTAFCTEHAIKHITVVADAGMLSQGNLTAIAAAGHRYIVGSRLYKIPYDIAAYQKTQPLSDGQIVESQASGHRIIYQYKAKRAELDLNNIQTQITKAQRVVDGETRVSRAKFLLVKAKTKQLNQTLIDKATALAGIKGYVTNLDISAIQVIDYYHQLFHVEASFRMAKSDLKARPIFHRKQDAIDAHLTMVLTALAMGRYLESQAGMSIKQLVNLLRPIRAGIVTLHGKEYQAEERITPVIHNLLEKLHLGH